MELFDENKNRIQRGAQLGDSGGEGSVYEVVGDNDSVIKLYHTSPANEKIQKLLYQKSLNTDGELKKIAAWPKELVFNKVMAVVGFLMPKVIAKDIHFLYRPADRVEFFPEATWESLVKVCRNLSSAFNTIHSRGVLMADVNEKNVQVTQSGEIRFIDCDSFQIKGQNGKIFLCDVGVPLWTPPEMQCKNFSHNPRSEQHDLFGLAALIFHLLFMGRHPFAGVPKIANRLTVAPSLEECIVKKQFPYSRNGHTNLGIPPHSLNLSALPEVIGNLFERAFLTTTRPTALEWWTALDSLKFKKCSWGHSYYLALPECPWCQIWNNGGNNYFIVKTTTGLSYGNERKIEILIMEVERAKFPLIADISTQILDISFVGWAEPSKQTLTPKNYSGKPLIENRIRGGYYIGWILALGSIFGIFTVPQAFLVWIILGIFAWHAIKDGKINPAYTLEKSNRKEAIELTQEKLEKQLENNLSSGKKYVSMFENTKTSAAVEIKGILENSHKHFISKQISIKNRLKILLNEYRSLSEKEKAITKDRRIVAQREDFLRGFRINKHSIPQIGPVRSSILARYGIETAWDAKNMDYIASLGQGTAYLSMWVNNLESRFVFSENKPMSEITKQEIRRDVSKIEKTILQELENIIKEWNVIKIESNELRIKGLMNTKLYANKTKLEQLNLEIKAINHNLMNEIEKTVANLGQAIADAKIE